MIQDKSEEVRNIFIIILILLFAFIFRISVWFNVKDFWIDESFQYLISQKSLSFILNSPDVHPPLFNIFTKLLLFSGITNILILRLVMVCISILFIYHFYQTTKEIFNQHIAIYSSLLISLSYTFIYYSIEFRSYMFVCLFTIIQIKYFNRILNNQTIDFNFSTAKFILFSLLMVYSHYLAGLILFTQIIFLIINWQKLKSFVKFEFLYTLPFLFCFSVPLLIYAIKTIPKIQSFWFKDIGLKSLISTFSYIITPPIDGLILFILFYGLIIIALIKFKWHWKQSQFIYYLIIPVILMWIISQMIPFYHHRYFLFGGLSFFILLGWAFEKFDNYKPDLGLFFFALWMLVFLLSAQQFEDSFDTELTQSMDWINNQTIYKNYSYIHTTTFSYLPFHVQFPHNKHYLLTNLTEKQLFTAGGSVIREGDIKTSLSFVNETNSKFLGISDKPIFKNIIYDKGGLYVTKN